MQLVETVETLPRRLEVIEEFKAGGGLVAAVFPIHYPRALFRAFNILPVEVWGPPGVDPSHGARHVQAYVCSIVRNAIAFVQTGGLEVADVLVVPHACDSLQGLGSLLIDFIVPRQPVLPIYIPRGRRESDMAFLADELRSHFERLGEITGRRPDEVDLMESITREEAADGLLAKLHHERPRLPLSDLAFYRLVRSREFLPAERFATLAQGTLEKTGQPPSPGIPLLLSGIVPEPMSLFTTLTELGGLVVADDLACCGRRLYPAGREQDPFRRMAERIIFGPPCSTRGNPIEERAQYLLGLAGRTGARGVIFYDVKFCEPELFDLPDLRRALGEAGLPSLLLEVDINDPLSNQMRTRLGGFMEMVG